MLRTRNAAIAESLRLASHSGLAGLLITPVPAAASNSTKAAGDLPPAENTPLRRGATPLPIAYYPFDGNALDFSGDIFPFEGVVQGGAGFGQGVFGDSLDLRNTDGWVDLPPILSDRTECSMAFWMRIESFDPRFSFNTILDEASVGSETLDVYFDPELEIYSPGSASAVVGDAPRPLPTGWHHVALVWQAAGTGQVRYYLNGVERSAQPRSAASCGANAPSTVGAFLPGSPGEDYFDGELDDLRIYGEALSASEVRDLFAAAQLVSEGRVDVQVPPSADPSIPDTNNLRLRVYGLNQLFELWPYFRLAGETSETRFPAPDSIELIEPDSSSLVLFWATGTLIPDVAASLILVPAECAGSSLCANGPGGAGLRAQFLIQNSGVSPVSLDAFLYSDVLIENSILYTAEQRPADDADFVIEVVEASSTPQVGSKGLAIIGDSFGGAVAFDAAPYRMLGDSLDDLSLTDLTNSGLPFGTDDFTMAIQTTFTIGSGELAGTFLDVLTNWAFFFADFEEGDFGEWSSSVP